MHVFKKMVALLLLAVMVLSLCACGKEKDKGNGGSGENSALSGKFSAGFGKVDITPKENVPLDSYGDAEHRISTGLLSYMYALAVAVTDTDGNSLIFVVGDQSWCSPSLQGQIRTEITNRTGVPGDHIVLSGTHTHAAPAPGLTENPAQARYNVQYTKGMVDAAVMAMEDRKPAKVYAGGVDTEKMNFVRRYIMDDGSLTGDNAVGTGTKIERHETIADPELQLLKFVREGGKDIVIGNFQAHPHLEGYRKELSSQTVGAFREAMEKVADVHCMHWQGAAGNLNSHSRMDENIFEQSPEGRKKYGEKMAEYAMSVYNDLEEVKTGPVRVISKIYEGKVNHEWDSKADVAQKIVDTWKSTNNKNKAMALAGDSKIGSVYHANRIVGNSKKGATEDMYQFACSFGDVGFIVMCYEMFDTNGMYVKEESPFERTFLIGYSAAGDGSSAKGYIPSALGWENRGYETDNSLYVGGTGEVLAQRYVDMLTELYNAK